MSDRKHLKKYLGLNEYPWSSDDDDDNNAHSTPETRLQISPILSRQSIDENPGTSGLRQALGDLAATIRLVSSPITVEGDTQSSQERRDQLNRGNPSSRNTAMRKTSLSHLRIPSNQHKAIRRIVDLNKLHKICDLTSYYKHFQARAGLCGSQKSTMSPSLALKLAATFKASRAKRSVTGRLFTPHHGRSGTHVSRGVQSAQPDLSPTRSLAEQPPCFSIRDIFNVNAPEDPSENVNQSNEENQASVPGQSVQADPTSPWNSPEPLPLFSSSPTNEIVKLDSSEDRSENLDQPGEEVHDVDIPTAVAQLSLEEEIMEVPAESDLIVNVGDMEPPQKKKKETSAAVPGTSNENPGPSGVKRKRNDNNETMSPKELNDNLLRLLECPVCMEWMEPPMSQCRRGHLVCSRCRDRLTACPVCRTGFSSVRNRAMEGVADLLRYPCRHGCPSVVRLRRRAAHEDSCPLRRYQCPAPTCMGATTTLLYKDIKRHFESKHFAILKNGHQHKFSIKLNTEQHEHWLIVALEELFLLRIDVAIRSRCVMVYVVYIGPKCRARNFVYAVTIIGEHHSRQMSYIRETHNDVERLTLNTGRQDCFHLTLEQALNFVRYKNKYCETDKLLDLNIKISSLEECSANKAKTESDS